MRNCQSCSCPPLGRKRSAPFRVTGEAAIATSIYPFGIPLFLPFRATTPDALGLATLRAVCRESPSEWIISIIVFIRLLYWTAFLNPSGKVLPAGTFLISLGGDRLCRRYIHPDFATRLLIGYVVGCDRRWSQTCCCAYQLERAQPFTPGSVISDTVIFDTVTSDTLQH